MSRTRINRARPLEWSKNTSEWFIWHIYSSINLSLFYPTAALAPHKSGEPFQLNRSNSCPPNMLLAVNQSVSNSKKRRDAEATGETSTTSTTATSQSSASRELTDSSTQLVANMLLPDEASGVGMGGVCQSCQHRQRQSCLPAGCKCSCNCINKLDAPPPTSLVLVYLYLGALTLMLATLSILFYTYTQAGEESVTVGIHQRQREQRNQFQDELLRSEHILRAMVIQIMERDYPMAARCE